MSAQATATLNQRIIELAAAQVDMPPEDVSLDSHFIADLGYDSLDQIEFMMTIEDEFDISVPDEEAEKIKTVRAAVQAIQKFIS